MGTLKGNSQFHPILTEVLSQERTQGAFEFYGKKKNLYFPNSLIEI